MKFSFKLLEKVKNQAGATAVIIAIVLPMLIGFGALAVDVGYMYVTKNELQNVADAAALAATRKLGSIYQGMTYDAQKTYVCGSGNTDIAVIKGVADAVAYNNKAGGEHIIVYDTTKGIDHVEIGVWDASSDPPSFTAKNEQPDAVRVTAHRDNAANGPITTFFAKIFGIDVVDVSAVATAALTAPAKLNEGELKVPFSLSKNNFPNDCTNPITFSPTADSCAGWHNFFDSANANDMADKLLGLIQGDVQTYPDHDPPLVNGPDWLVANFDMNAPPDAEITPVVGTGDEINHQGGTISSLFLGGRLGNTDNDINLSGEILGDAKHPAPFPALFDYFRRRDDDDDDTIWTATVPVYEDDDVCENPSGAIPIIGFAIIEIHMPNPPPDSSVSVFVYCELIFVDGRGGGGSGAYGNVKGTIPNLVE
jgi:Flp pilus assembly protein TadG